MYFDEKGSKDLCEFLGRAGVSIAKAGATAALGSVFAAAGLMILGGIFATVGMAALPVALVVAVVVGGTLEQPRWPIMLTTASGSKKQLLDGRDDA